jgi:hypothetical protein
MNVTIGRTTPSERAPSPPARFSLTLARPVPGRLEGPGGREEADSADARSREEAWETDGGASRPSNLPRHIGLPGRRPPSGQGM